jgi:hypothetical protein
MEILSQLCFAIGPTPHMDEPEEAGRHQALKLTTRVTPILIR